MEWNAKVMQKMEKIGCDESVVLSTFNCGPNCVALYNYHAPASILIVNYNLVLHSELYWGIIAANYTDGLYCRVLRLIALKLNDFLEQYPVDDHADGQKAHSIDKCIRQEFCSIGHAR